jgi:hypothetical protein
MSKLFENLHPEQCGPWSLMLRRLQIQFRYFRKFRRFANLEEPNTFTEKTQFRKLYGNHAVYALLADKYRVREFVTERVGTEVLIPLLGVYDLLTPEVFEALPDQFIIKANHGCKWHQIVQDKSALDIPATIRRFNGLLQRRYGRTSAEFHYGLIEPKIVIEKLLVDRGDSPVDYNIFCFHNANGFEYGFSATTPRNERRAAFDQDWNMVDGTCTPEEIELIKNPPNWDRMIEIAEALSRGFDFVRVDLYNLHGQIYFGELTFTPAGGLKPITNPDRAALRNSQWHLDRKNPLLYRQQTAA